MTRNSFEIRISLPKSDGFHTKNDRHMAEIVGHHVQRLLKSHAVPQSCEARITQSRTTAGPDPAARAAIRQMETLLAQWAGSDWGYTQQTQQIRRIIQAFRSGTPLSEMTQEP